jgi:hypothetical protein
VTENLMTWGGIVIGQQERWSVLRWLESQQISVCMRNILFVFTTRVPY